MKILKDYNDLVYPCVIHGQIVWNMVHFVCIVSRDGVHMFPS